MASRIWVSFTFAFFICLNIASAQQRVDAVLQLSSGYSSSTGTLMPHPCGDLYFNTTARGTYRLDTSDFSLHMVAGSSRAEYHTARFTGAGINSTYFISFDGPEGGGCMIIDSIGTARHLPGAFTNRGGDFFAGYSAENWYQASVDGGFTWFSAPSDPPGNQYEPFGLALFRDTGHTTLLAAHRSSPDSLVVTAIPARLTNTSDDYIRYMVVSSYAQDSIMWFHKGYDRADTMCRAKLGDTTCLCDTLVGGKVAKALFLQNDRRGNLLYADKSGNVGRYHDGAWHWQPGQVPVSDATTYVSRSHEDILLSNNNGNRTSIRIPFDSSQSIVIDTLPYRGTAVRTLGKHGYLASGPASIWRRSPTESISLASILFRTGLFPSVLAFHGITRTDGTPMAVMQDDALSAPMHHGLANFIEGPIHERSFLTIDGSRGDFSENGLLPSFTTPTNILFPGRGAYVHTRDGMRVRSIERSLPTTAVHVTAAADTLLGTPDALLLVYRADGTRDTLDMHTALCGTPDAPRGYVSHMHTFDASTWVVAVSGRQRFDDSVFEAVPYECGGLLHTTDAGATWSVVELSAPASYMIAMTATSQGNLVVSATNCILGGTPNSITFNGRHVFRSSDKGRSWTKVHEQGCNLPLRVVGGYGVETDAGTLLIPGTDELLESANDGLTWDVHTLAYPGDTLASNRVTSVFKHAEGGPVYYCTEQGLYKGAATTSAEERIDPADTGELTVTTTSRLGHDAFVIHVATATADPIQTMVVVDLLGNVIASLPHAASGLREYDASIPTQSWPSGMYYLTVRTAHRSRTVPLLKVD